MARRIVTRLRYRRTDSPPNLWSRFATHAGAVMLGLGVLALAYGLYQTTVDFAQRKMDSPVQTWNEKGFSAADRVERSWSSIGVPPPFTQGDEPSVQAFLREHPLLVALWHDSDDTLWIRRGDILARAGAEPEAARWRAWAQEAAMNPTLQWFPKEAENPDAGRHPVEVLTAGPWRAVMRWEIGSATVERMLQHLLRPDFHLRLGLKPDSTTKGTPLQPWGEWPHLQMDPGRIAHLKGAAYEIQTNAFGKGFSMGVSPSPDDALVLHRMYRTYLFQGGSLATAFLLLLLLGGWVRTRLRRRAMLESDRLASLAHSLKTPLAILKFRCDSLRLGRLSPEQADEQLLRLGQEVDHLTLIIDSGLRAIKGDREQKPTAEVSPDWIRDVASDLDAAFETEERALNLNLCPEPGEAVLASFRSALLTLLENGLEHGEGAVELLTRRNRNQLVLTVTDEGPGMDQAALNSLGRPFQRMRPSGSEGFRREGLGLGLSLLFHTAEQEGWGLAFTSEAGKGTTAELRIPLAGRGPIWDRVLASLRHPLGSPLEQIKT